MQRGFSAIYVLVVILMIGVTGGGFYWLGTQKNYPTNKIQQIDKASSVETIPSSLVTSTSTPNLVSQENAIYLGTYKGLNALFFTNKTKQEYTSPDRTRKIDPNIGSLTTQDGIRRSPFNYNDLQDSKKIFIVPFNIQQINNFKFSDNKKILYISLMLETKTANRYPDNLENYIYKIDLDNLTYVNLWVYDLSLNKYKGANGSALVKQASSDNNYLVLSIFNCFACEGSEAGLLILNNQTKNEKYFSRIGNIQFNLSEGIFTYQKTAPFKEPCDDPACGSDGTWTVYKPSGDTFTEKLP